MNAVFCISAGQLVTKKSNSLINRKNRYLNYGLLSLASVIKRTGVDSIQIQGGFESPELILNIAIEKGLDHSQFPVLVSVPSFYAISWTNEFISLLKSHNPLTKVIIGGRWVIDGEVSRMMELVPLADRVIPGLAENEILSEIGINIKPEQVKGRVSPHSKLDYSLLHEREIFQPSIEVSRGCGMGCSFCQERNEPLTKLKPVNDLSEELSSIILQDNLRTMTPYFESSIFAPNESWIRELIHKREAQLLDYKWRTEARVDSIHEKHMSNLAKAGLRVVDLGLESADHGQLLKMRKTKDPARYLEKASLLIKSADDAGIKVKLNIMLFAGETYESINNTLDWLRQHKSSISGVSVGPVILFGWPHKVKPYLEHLNSFGATMSHDAVFGASHINLSNEIDYEKSIEISRSIGREFTSAYDYYFLKSFSYFPRDYSYDQFLIDAEGSKQCSNFRITERCRAITG